MVELDTEIGNTLFLLGRFDEAIAAYQRSIAGFEELFGASTMRANAPRGNVAEVLVRLGRGAEAAALFEQLIARNPTPAYWDGLAQAHRANRAPEKAIAAYENAITAGLRFDRRSIEACWGHIGIAEVLFETRRHTEVSARVASAIEACEGKDGVLEVARLAFVRSKDHALRGQPRAARETAMAARAAVADAPVGSPAASLRADLDQWLATLLP